MCVAIYNTASLLYQPYSLSSEASICCLPDEVHAVCLFHCALADKNIAAAQCLKTATFNVWSGVHSLFFWIVIDTRLLLHFLTAV